MVKTLTITKCDLCGKERNQLHKIILPMPFYDLSSYIHYRTDKVSTMSADACEKCCRKIIKAIEPMFTKYGDYGEYAYKGRRMSLKKKKKQG